MVHFIVEPIYHNVHTLEDLECHSVWLTEKVKRQINHSIRQDTHKTLKCIVVRYSRKIWQGFKFGGLAVEVETAKLKSANIMLAVPTMRKT